MAVDPTPVFWNRILEEVQSRLPSAQAFDTWFQPVRARRVSDDVLELEVPSLFFAQWIEQHYASTLADACASVLGRVPQVRFVIEPALAAYSLLASTREALLADRVTCMRS